jgi:acyl-CoA reductase-like NAD-dependent aldehyde dehydrogenase
VVFDDADLTAAVNGAAFAAFVASGQTCVSGTRLIVQAGIYDEFVSGFVDKVKSIARRMGSRGWTHAPSYTPLIVVLTALNPQSTMGSVIGVRQLERIHAMVKGRASGTILVGGEPLTGVSQLDGFNFSKGSFYPPTVIADVDTTDELWREEVFGPVVVIKQFEVRTMTYTPVSVTLYLLMCCSLTPTVLPLRMTASTVLGPASGRGTYLAVIALLLK